MSFDQWYIISKRIMHINIKRRIHININWWWVHCSIGWWHNILQRRTLINIKRRTHIDMTNSWYTNKATYKATKYQKQYIKGQEKYQKNKFSHIYFSPSHYFYSWLMLLFLVIFILEVHDSHCVWVTLLDSHHLWGHISSLNSRLNLLLS